MIYDKCPGTDRLRSSTITEKACPRCGSIIEIFSADTGVACERCGFVVYNDAPLCMQWCAEKCIGTELCGKLVRNRKVDPDTPK